MVAMETSSPAHFHIAHVGVEVEQRPNADGVGHDLVELRPLGRVQVQHVEDELPELRAVAVRYWGKSPTHDLQNQGRQVLQTEKSEHVHIWELKSRLEYNYKACRPFLKSG